jgi:hypothetical protein
MSHKYKYVFRGTTIEYQGGVNSKSNSFTCTSTHPVKALWFALECLYRYPEEAVVYIAEIASLDNVNRGANVLEETENEIAFMIEPAKFYKYCMGYISVQDMQTILKEAGWDSYQNVRKDNLSRLCYETLAIEYDEVEKLVKSMLPFIKNK